MEPAREKPVYGSSEYDAMYETNDTTYERPTRSQYYRMFRTAAEKVRRQGIRNVLEVGCGSGVLAEMVIAKGIGYHGFDISSVGVEKAKRRNPGGTFFVGDATAAQSYAPPYDGILCCEVLEHIDGDLDAIGLWKSGVPVVCSVPNFDFYTHVRFFRSEQEVISRYSGLVRIDAIQRINRPVRGNRSFIQYAKTVRWKMQEGDVKGSLGMLGIRQFDWNGGWFLFTGTRR